MNIARTYKRRVSSSSDYAHANAAERYTGNPAAITKVRRTADYSYDGNPQGRDTFSLSSLPGNFFLFQYKLNSTK